MAPTSTSFPLGFYEAFEIHTAYLYILNTGIVCHLHGRLASWLVRDWSLSEWVDDRFRASLPELETMIPRRTGEEGDS